MSLTFPTDGRMRRSGIPPEPGNPTRASHCICVPGPLLVAGQDTCLSCGKHSRDTVAETWARRAREIARKR